MVLISGSIFKKLNYGQRSLRSTKSNNLCFQRPFTKRHRGVSGALLGVTDSPAEGWARKWPGAGARLAEQAGGGRDTHCNLRPGFLSRMLAGVR